MKLFNNIQIIVAALFAWIFPIRCILCDREGLDICEVCLRSLPWPKPRRYRWVASLWNYRDPRTKQILYTIKRIPHKRLLKRLAQFFSAVLVNPPQNPDSWVVIAIPISAARFRERGFNQSELMARTCAQALGLTFCHRVLKKQRRTKKQGTTKDSEERKMNMYDAFRVEHPELIQGKNILICDDVTTTGSTLLAAREALLASGAHKVLALTLAN